MTEQQWPGLDLRHLTAFQAVAVTGSFAAAAKRLGYTQPAVSQQIAALEKIVGHRLFERASGRSISELTEAGESLLAHVDAVLKRLASARADLETLADGGAATLRIGALQTIAVRIVPLLVRRMLSGAHPVRLEVREDVDDTSMLAELEAGLLDFAFVMLPVDDRRFRTLELVEDPYFLVAPRGDRRARELASLTELERVPMIGRSTCRCWEIVTAQFHAAGIEPNYVFRSDDAFSVIGHVRSGLGLAIVSQLTIEMVNTDDIEVVPLNGLIAPRRLVLAWNRDREHSATEARLLGLTRNLSAELRRAQPQSRHLVAAAGYVGRVA